MCSLYAYLEERTEMDHTHDLILEYNQNWSAYLILKSNTRHEFI